MRSSLAWCGLAVLTVGAAAGTAAARPAPPPGKADPPPALVSFQREVLPLLQRACLGCHGVGTTLAKLDMRTREGLLRGGTRGPAVVPGSAAKSLLVQMVRGSRTPPMPPTGRLPAADVALLARWVNAGASWTDAKVETASEQVWWSWKPPVAPPLPELKHAEWVRNPIDRFVLKRLREKGLRPAPEAPRRVLIRRASLDLTGLPPTPEEIEAFERDPSPDAWEKVVDRLLASPRYGERWGRHWLDLVRYADSSGFEGDKDRPHAWRYRDYVIRAFNQDRPYPEFLKEQIAGDEIRPGDREALIATGYLGLGVEDFAMAKLPTTRADELDDLVHTTTATVLGLTVNCARCHDHKYDRISQKDFYRLTAIFAPTVRKEVEIPTAEEKAAADRRNAELDAQVLPLKAEQEPLARQGTAAAQAAGIAKPTPEQIAQHLPEEARRRFQELGARIAALEGQRPRLPTAMTVTDAGPKADPHFLLVRGDAYKPGEKVEPGFIATLPGGNRPIPAVATPTTTGRRRALAEWLASSENPLTARVWVNRVWRQHFGQGIVATPSNFGLSGELPSHPELLDWLAVQFMASPPAGPRGSVASTGPVRTSGSPWGMGWRTKALHRLILTSAAWRQSSVPRIPAPGAPDPRRVDPENRLLWKMPLRRLEAEPIRDSILYVAGSLDLTMGGPPVYPPVDPSLRADTFQGYNWPEAKDTPDTWRRSVYIKVKRSLLFPELEVFDCPEITSHVERRNVSTTPLQALTMMNSPLVHRQAARFAERLERECGGRRGAQIERAYRLCFGRSPTPVETRLGLEFLARRPLAEYCHALFNLNEFLYVE